LLISSQQTFMDSTALTERPTGSDEQLRPIGESLGEAPASTSVPELDIEPAIGEHLQPVQETSEFAPRKGRIKNFFRRVFYVPIAAITALRMRRAISKGQLGNEDAMINVPPQPEPAASELPLPPSSILTDSVPHIPPHAMLQPLHKQ